MRKLTLFGFKNGLAINFEYPIEKDMLAMPLNKPIEVIGLNWHESDAHYIGKPWLGALQVILSNGVKSPVFLGTDQVQKNLH